MGRVDRRVMDDCGHMTLIAKIQGRCDLLHLGPIKPPGRDARRRSRPIEIYLHTTNRTCSIPLPDILAEAARAKDARDTVTHELDHVIIASLMTDDAIDHLGRLEPRHDA